jgi:serine/threonine-protein kinase
MPPTRSTLQTDRNLLFGVLALQADLLDAARFAEVCAAWSACKDKTLADLLVERGWLTSEDRRDVERLLERKLKKHSGDAHASLAGILNAPTRDLLAAVADPEVQHSLAGLTPDDGPALLATTAYQPENRERYTLTRVHSRGGIGQVWLARDDDLGREVALKEIRPDRSGQTEIWARFVEEARITGQLQHPGIVPVYELSRRRADRQPFYTMRFVRGQTLREASKVYHRKRAAGQTDPLDLRELLGQFIAVCNAVAYAHDRGVIHRDLKGQNVVVGDFGEVIVLDWGLAKLIGQAEPRTAPPVEADPSTERGETVQGQVIGTPGYLSPEQAEGRLDQIGPRTDVYGLGAILYEVLTGEAPFVGSDTHELIRRVVHEAPVPPHTLIRETPPALEAVCLKALAKEPTQRYASAAELASEIRHFLADEPVSAHRDGLLARGGRWARRHRTLVAGLATAALVAVVSLTAATLLLSAANHREREARQLAQSRGEEAEREGAKARANFQLARNAVETYGTRVCDDPRLKEKDLEKLRQELLQSAVAFHEQLIAQQRDDPSLRADLGRAYADLGKLLGEIDQLGRAIAVCLQAVAAYEELATEQPEDRSYPLKLAQSLDVLGTFLDTNARIPEARAAFERALTTLDAVRDQPGDPLLARRTYLRASSHLASLLIYKRGAQADGIAAYRKAAAYLEAEARRSDSEPLDDVLTAETYATLGSLLIESGQSEEGQSWCDKCKQTLEPLLARGKPPTDLCYNLGNVYISLDRAHFGLRDWPQAIDASRKAVDLYLQLLEAHPNVSKYQVALGVAYNDLARFQHAAGRRVDGIQNYQKSIEVKERLATRYPEVPDYKANLIRSLTNLARVTPDLDQARDLLRRAEVLARELKDRYPAVADYQDTFISVLRLRTVVHERANQQREAVETLDQAIAAQQKLVQTSDVREHRQRLARFYLHKVELAPKAGKPEAAVDALRQALALDVMAPEDLYKRGSAFLTRNRLDEAILVLSKLVALKSDHAEARCNLGHALVRRGRFVEGRAALQRGHELGSKKSGWKYRSQEWVQNAEKLIQLDERLTAIRDGKAQPANATEQLALAGMCSRYKRLYGTAAKFYAGAFAERPQLADDRKAAHRYNAARAAALAGCGKGEDAAKSTDQERARWRQEALNWLQAELAVRTKEAATASASGRTAIRKVLRQFQTDVAFAGVREEAALSRLPADERAAWRKLWAEVTALVDKIGTG